MLVHRLAKALVVATLLLVAWGGTVTSTNSGLACGDHWPACFEVRRAEAGEDVRPTLVPRMEGGVLIEHGHRALASTIGVGAIVLLALAMRERPVDRGLRRTAALARALVVVPGRRGALTVWMRLPAAVTILHLTFSMTFLGSLLLLAFRSRPGLVTGRAPARGVRRLTLTAAALVFAQLVFGALVRHTGAAPVCTAQFPLCNGAWLPDTGEQWIHIGHRTFAFVALGVVAWAAFAARRAAADLGRPGVRLLAGATLLFVTAQATLGVVTVLTGIRPVWATLHLVGGALVWVSVLGQHLAIGPLGAPSRDAAVVEPVRWPGVHPQSRRATRRGEGAPA
jgi:heme A synthase